MLKASIYRIAVLTAIWSITFSPFQAQAETIEKIGVPLFEVPDLFNRSGGALHGIIAVSGILRCSSLSTCWFEHPNNPKRRVKIDIRQISSRERDYFRGCVSSPCGELLVGLVDRVERGARFRMLR
jgi:hypothetical protein